MHLMEVTHDKFAAMNGVSRNSLIIMGKKKGVLLKKKRFTRQRKSIKRVVARIKMYEMSKEDTSTSFKQKTSLEGGDGSCGVPTNL